MIHWTRKSTGPVFEFFKYQNKCKTWDIHNIWSANIKYSLHYDWVFMLRAIYFSRLEHVTFYVVFVGSSYPIVAWEKLLLVLELQQKIPFL